VNDLQKWLDKIPDLVSDLHVTVARLDRIRKQSEGRPGTKTGSAAPINIGAFQIRWYLEAISLNAKDHAKDPEAATIAKNIRDAVNEGELLVLGPAEPTPRPRVEIREELSGHVEPLTAKECAGWLSKVTGVKFTSRQIRHWVERRGLRPVETDGWPKYRPEDVLAAYERAERRAAFDHT
jgi:transposase